MNKTVYLIYFIMCSLVLVGIIWSAPDHSRSSSDEDAEAAISIMGGNPGAADRRKSPDRYDGESSFFEDPSFMDAGTGDNSIDEEAADPVALNNGEEPDILEPVNENNPVNPQTGQPYTNAAMKKFDKLRKRFPNNDLIPRVKSQAEKDAEAESRKQMFALQSQVVQGKASATDVNKYYDMQMKTYKDREQLLNYVFTSMADKMSDSIKEQYEKVQQMNERQIKMMEEQRTRALARVQQN